MGIKMQITVDGVTFNDRAYHPIDNPTGWGGAEGPAINLPRVIDALRADAASGTGRLWRNSPLPSPAARAAAEIAGKASTP